MVASVQSPRVSSEKGGITQRAVLAAPSRLAPGDDDHNMATTEATSLAQAWRQRFSRERSDLARERESSLAQARACARLLGERYGASQVYLVGSLARGHGFHASSDIDLAVRGLRPDDLLGALDALYSITDRDVDLVRLEEATPSFAQRATTTGRLLYG